MKIQNKNSINSTSTKKPMHSSTTGAFGQLLEINSREHQPHDNASGQASSQTEKPNQDTAPVQEAWNTLEESVSLLDKAMHCLETGNSPPQQLIRDIEQLRGLLRQQVASGGAALELKQADTLLAVEAERIRSMQS